MVLIYLVGVSLLIVALSTFFYINLSFLNGQYLKVKKAYFPHEDKSAIEAFKYLLLTEKNTKQINIVCAILLGVIFLNFNMGFFGPFLGAVVGWLTPQMLIKRAQAKKIKKIQDQYAPSLVLLANAMKAGETLEQAIASTGEVIQEPLSFEYVLAVRQLRVGMQLNEVFEDFERRWPLPDIKISNKAMLISIRTGADLPSALARIADTIRNRGAIQGKIDSLTAQGKAQGIVVGLLPVFLMLILYVMDPQFIRPLFTTLIGNAALAVMVVMEVMGFFVIKKIITIDI
jgi:tight adherence protein B